MSAVRPAIYSATVNGYSDGILHAAWINAAQPSEEIERETARLSTTWPTTLPAGEPAEELAIHDYEAFAQPIDAHEGVAVIGTAAQLALDSARPTNG